MRRSVQVGSGPRRGAALTWRVCLLTVLAAGQEPPLATGVPTPVIRHGRQADLRFPRTFAPLRHTRSRTARQASRLLSRALEPPPAPARSLLLLPPSFGGGSER